MEVSTTEDKIHDAAVACPEAADTLKELFPDVFGPEWIINGVYRHLHTGIYYKLCDVGDKRFQLIKIRGSGAYFTCPMLYSTLSKNDLTRFTYIGISHDVIHIYNV